jgi:hypothetical protein
LTRQTCQTRVTHVLKRSKPFRNSVRKVPKPTSSASRCLPPSARQTNGSLKHTWPVVSAGISVVPVPMNGSNAACPGLGLFRIGRRMRSTCFRVRCRVAASPSLPEMCQSVGFCSDVARSRKSRRVPRLSRRPAFVQILPRLLPPRGFPSQPRRLFRPFAKDCFTKRNTDPVWLCGSLLIRFAGHPKVLKHPFQARRGEVDKGA